MRNAAAVVRLPLPGNAEPPAIRRGRRRQADGGPTVVSLGSWVDPDDIKPDARKVPRRIDGWRTFCPLRRLMAAGGGVVTETHILAADWLRLKVDLGVIGRSRSRYDGQEKVDGGSHGARTGPSAIDVSQIVALSEVEHALRPFSMEQIRMMAVILLENYSLQRWAQAEEERLMRRVDPKVETGKLVAILEILAKSCETEIEELSRQGRLLAP